jgi:hypothetical protein
MNKVIYRIKVNGYAREYSIIDPDKPIQQHVYELKLIDVGFGCYSVTCTFYHIVYDCGTYDNKLLAQNALRRYMKEAMHGRIHKIFPRQKDMCLSDFESDDSLDDLLYDYFM